MEQVWSDGATLRDHLQAVEIQTGRTPARLQVPPVPPAFQRIWAIWVDLNSRRQAGFGPATFSWQDIHAYCSVTKEVLSVDDLAVISIIEGQYFASAEAAADRRKREGKPDGK